MQPRRRRGPPSCCRRCGSHLPLAEQAAHHCPIAQVFAQLPGSPHQAGTGSAARSLRLVIYPPAEVLGPGSADSETVGVPWRAMSDSGSRAGAAVRWQVRSDAVIVGESMALTCGNVVYQRLRRLERFVRDQAR